jgi:hypothetical protein
MGGHPSRVDLENSPRVWRLNGYSHRSLSAFSMHFGATIQPGTRQDPARHADAEVAFSARARPNARQFLRAVFGSSRIASMGFVAF